jgi:D-psicose/D-tagatose/L-ribulose 3-epimerase
MPATPRLGFNLLLWTTSVTEAHFPIIAALARAGYDGVEIPLLDPASDRPGAVARHAAEHGLACTAMTALPGPDHNPCGESAADRQRALDHLKRALDAAAELGSATLIGPTYQPLACFTGQPVTETEWARCVEVHLAAGEHAAELGVTLGVEPLNRFEAHVLNTIGQAARFVRDVGHPNVRQMADTFHLNIEETDPGAAVRDNLDTLIHFHLSENDRGTPGEGRGPIREVVQAALAGGYTGWFVLEAFGRELPAMAAAVRVWRDFFPSPEFCYTRGLANVRRMLA